MVCRFFVGLLVVMVVSVSVSLIVSVVGSMPLALSVVVILSRYGDWMDSGCSLSVWGVLGGSVVWFCVYSSADLAPWSISVLMAWLVALIWAVLMHSCSDELLGSLVVHVAVAIAVFPSGAVACMVNIHVVVLFSRILCFCLVVRVSS